MRLIEVVRYFRTIKHPIGDVIYIKIGLEFSNEENADEFRNKEKLEWEDGIVVEEITEEEYILATEKVQCSNCKKIIDEGYTINDGLEHYCSDECLYKNISEEDYKKIYEMGFAFWTTFED